MTNRIEYRKGNMFVQAPKGAYFAHACNAKGKWGKGIALEFKKRFPHSYDYYVRACEYWGDLFVGHSYTTMDRVICLVTSNDYGANKDPPERILKATDLAIQDLFAKQESNIEIHSGKFNSVNFGVPWELTAKVIELNLVTNPGVKWVVWEKA